MIGGEKVIYPLMHAVAEDEVDLTSFPKVIGSLQFQSYAVEAFLHYKREIGGWIGYILGVHNPFVGCVVACILLLISY